MNNTHTVGPVNTQPVFEYMNAVCEKVKPWDVVAKIFAYIGYCLTVVLPLADACISVINYFKSKASYSQPQLIQLQLIQPQQVQTQQVQTQQVQTQEVQTQEVQTQEVQFLYTVQVENAQDGSCIGRIGIPLEKKDSFKDYLVTALLAKYPPNVSLPINFIFYDKSAKPLKDSELSITATPEESLYLAAMEDVGIRTIKKEALKPNLCEEVLVYVDGCKAKVKIDLSKLNRMKKATVPIDTELQIVSVENFEGNNLEIGNFYAKVTNSTNLDVTFQVGCC